MKLDAAVPEEPPEEEEEERGEIQGDIDPCLRGTENLTRGKEAQAVLLYGALKTKVWSSTPPEREAVSPL